MVKRFAIGVLSLLLLLSLSACGKNETNQTANSGGGSELVVVDWGGAITEARKKAIFEPFEKKYGVKISITTPTDYGKFKAMVQSGNVNWDVVNVESDFVIRGAKENLLEKLDYNIISKDGMIKELVNDYGIGSELYSTVIAYNTQANSSQHPTNWAEFWDTNKFPGSRSLYKSPMGTLESALLADGVDPNKLYPLDVDRAFKSLDKIKKDVKVWWNAGAQPPQLLASGDVTIAAAWNGRISAAKKEGAPVDVEFNQGLVMGESWVIPKGSKHKDLAMKFISFATAPEQQAAFSSNIDYAPANQKALDLLSIDVKNRLGQSPENANNQIVVDIDWWVNNFDEVNERFQQWLLK